MPHRTIQLCRSTCSYCCSTVDKDFWILYCGYETVINLSVEGFLEAGGGGPVGCYGCTFLCIQILNSSGHNSPWSKIVFWIETQPAASTEILRWTWWRVDWWLERKMRPKAYLYYLNGGVDVSMMSCMKERYTVALRSSGTAFIKDFSNRIQKLG